MSKGAATKQAILDDAGQLASRLGLGGLTIGKLATATEMSKSGLFAHFRSKESLQTQVLERARERFVDTVMRPTIAAPRGEKRLRTLLDRWLIWTNEAFEGGCLFIAASVELDDQPGPVRDELVRNERDFLDMIATVAGTAVSEGQFRQDLDLDQFAYEVHGVMLAHNHCYRLLQEERAVDRARSAFESLISAARAS